MNSQQLLRVPAFAGTTTGLPPDEATHGNGVWDSFTLDLEFSDRYRRRIACSSLPLRRDGAGMRRRRLIFPGSGICRVTRGATVGLSSPCLLSMFFMYVRA